MHTPAHGPYGCMELHVPEPQVNNYKSCTLAAGLGATSDSVSLHSSPWILSDTAATAAVTNSNAGAAATASLYCLV